jgi:osmoprotectant transport system substrate-binding protein
MKNTRKIAAIAVAAAAGLAFSGCSNPVDSGGDSGDAKGDDKIVVSSANFVESEIIGNLYAEALKANDIPVETKFNIGSREAYVPALTDGSIDLIPDYTGNLLLYLDKDADLSTDADVDGELAKQLEKEDLKMYDPAPAEDTDTLTVTSELAKKWKLKSIGDLADHNDELTVGGMPEFEKRDRGLPGVKDLYGVSPDKFEKLNDGGGPATVKALLDGTVDAANIFTTSPDIPEHNLVVLEDPKGNFPKQNVVPVISKNHDDPEVEKVLNQISEKLTTDELTKLNEMVSGKKKLEPKQAATTWLKDEGIVD